MARNIVKGGPMPAINPEDREKQLINMAYNAVEKRIAEGTASSGEYVHFLKLGSRRSELELELKRAEIELARQKAANLESERASSEMIERALKAFSIYSGHDDE